MDYAHEKGRWVWIKPIQKNSEFNTPIGCQIVRFDRGKALIRNDDGDEYWIKLDQIIKSMHITSVYGVEDMISLGEINECAILRNLRIRYKNKQIYTYTGTVLAAINPYENLHIYSNNLINQYKRRKITDLPPHIYAISNLAYCKCIDDNQNQCIVISGESGAGKTESMKFILQYLTAISKKSTSVQKQILEANPILEAFGNAKTIRNDNSSRFGKYIDIQFDLDGTIKCAKFNHYLLEKSRIVSVNAFERNYHIFYMLLNGLTDDERDTLELDANRRYNYLMCHNNSSQQNEQSHRFDELFNDLDHVKTAMKILSFCEWEIWQIFQLLSALLHLGNLTYKRKIIENIDATEIHDNLNSSRVAHFLGIPRSVLCECLTRRTIYINDERVVSNISMEYAIQIRDSFAKTIYGRIFNWIVQKINNTISRGGGGGANIPDNVSIGVLDIFGFENFAINSFEQLCINYANESLQQFFVQQIFKMEQNEYNKEKIIWKKIPFIDNQSVLDVIGVKPMNIMSLIDEESKFPKGTDNTLLLKLNRHHGSNSVYVKSLNDYDSPFGIRHFAGVVMYTARGFLEKNRDTFGSDLKELIAQSNNAFLLSLFEKNGALDSGRKTMTLSLQFKNSLDDLMKTLTACNPYFIRCIKPNDFKRPNDFDDALCVRQLRYTGMLETARIRALGYPIRHAFKQFIQRYRLLAPNLLPNNDSFVNHRELCKRLCSHLLKFNPNYQLGQTKVFLKYDQDAYLETEREKAYIKQVLVLQRFARRVLLTLWLKRREKAAIIIQAHWRGRCARRIYRQLHDAVERLQARIRSRQEAYAYQQYTKNIVRLQSLCRGYLTRRKVENQRRKFEEEIQRQRAEAMKNMRISSQRQPSFNDIQIRNNQQKAVVRTNGENIEFDADAIIDDMFDFLQQANDESIVDVTQKRTTNVSKMILNFEAESRIKKAIPTKLLSRPVNFYSFESRL